MGKMKKKHESGAATAFIPRNQAIKKLQLTIADFRRLCILKGVYPVEPKNKKKVNKGKSGNRTFYFAKDINYLASDPIINKFREFKIYVKRIKRAKGRRDVKALGRLRANKPSYKIDHIVKERYPTYTDAIRDLDDCLSLIFLFSVLPKSKRVYVERVQLAKKLSLEFMHFLIASKSLRKCFISIKGYYFQAEIKGQKVTWVMPHKLAYQCPDDVDFRIMSTFVEFYSIMLGFVNFKSYQDIGLFYPPKLSISNNDSNTNDDEFDLTDLNDEYLASLNCDVIKINQNEDESQGDEFPLVDEENPDRLENIKLEEDNLNKLKVLFKGLKFFLNREVPREAFVLAIRSFSGQVSWDKTSALGSTYQETDETITHQIVDRPLTGKTYLNRVYVQPQWVFDCINENMLLPVDEYLPGAVLPPHLSPFVDSNDHGYIPPEKQKLIKMKLGITENEDTSVKETLENKLEEKDENEEKKALLKKDVKSQKKEETKIVKKKPSKNSESEEESEESEEEVINDMKVDLDSPGEEEESDLESDKSEDEKEEEKVDKTKKPIIAVVKAQPKKENKNLMIKRQADEEKKLTEMMIPKKNKRLYDKIMKSKKKKNQEVEKLTQKRKIYEENKSKNGKKIKQ